MLPTPHTMYRLAQLQAADVRAELLRGQLAATCTPARTASRYPSLVALLASVRARLRRYGPHAAPAG
ncbi:MAG: hypothetical protein IT338_19840 [Thermomicrobiales bacterium]|nr:hypothetical protein [Thermomicrobiales bacterium]